MELGHHLPLIRDEILYVFLSLPVLCSPAFVQRSQEEDVPVEGALNEFGDGLVVYKLVLEVGSLRLCIELEGLFVQLLSDLLRGYFVLLYVVSSHVDQR